MSGKKTTLPAFNPPGYLTEFNADTANLWSKKCISHWMTGEIDADPDIVEPGRTPLSQFFNGTKTPYDQEQVPATVSWTAFPKRVTTAFKKWPLEVRWQVADSQRMFQDEYLEWTVKRDAETNDILSVTYTCEGPEYWSAYASFQPDDFFKTVKKLNPEVADQMRLSDFFLTNPKTNEKVYNPSNNWNCWTYKGSIIHLAQPNNKLIDEVDIAAQATVLRKDKDGNSVTREEDLIECSKYGNAGRHSDPHIGGSINGIARDGAKISIADPVAIYIKELNTSALKLDTRDDPDDEPEDSDLVDVPEGTFTFVRGQFNPNDHISKRRGLRLKLQLPPDTKSKSGKHLNVSNIWDTDTQRHIEYGAQIADHIKQGVDAVVIAGEPAEEQPCFGENFATDSTKAHVKV